MERALLRAESLANTASGTPATLAPPSRAAPTRMARAFAAQRRASTSSEGSLLDVVKPNDDGSLRREVSALEVTRARSGGRIAEGALTPLSSGEKHVDAWCHATSASAAELSARVRSCHAEPAAVGAVVASAHRQRIYYKCSSSS